MERFRLIEIAVPMVVGDLLVFLVSPFVEGMGQMIVIGTGILIGLSGFAKASERGLNPTDLEFRPDRATIQHRSSAGSSEGRIDGEVGRFPIGAGVVFCERPAVWDAVIENWKAFATACEEAGGNVQSVSVAVQASLAEIEEAEGALGMPLPHALRRVLTEFSARVDYGWLLHADNCDEAGNQVPSDSAVMQWSLRDIVRFQQNNAEWFSECCPNMLAVCEVPNGDIIAIDYGEAGKESVRYWSHDGWEHSGLEVAPDFASWLIETSKNGAVGPEYCYWMPFVDEATSRLDSDGDSAREFRRAMKVDIARSV